MIRKECVMESSGYLGHYFTCRSPNVTGRAPRCGEWVRHRGVAPTMEGGTREAGYSCAWQVRKLVGARPGRRLAIADRGLDEESYGQGKQNQGRYHPQGKDRRAARGRPPGRADQADPDR